MRTVSRRKSASVAELRIKQNIADETKPLYLGKRGGRGPAKSESRKPQSSRKPSKPKPSRKAPPHSAKASSKKKPSPPSASVARSFPPPKKQEAKPAGKTTHSTDAMKNPTKTTNRTMFSPKPISKSSSSLATGKFLEDESDGVSEVYDISTPSRGFGETPPTVVKKRGHTAGKTDDKDSDAVSDVYYIPTPARPKIETPGAAGSTLIQQQMPRATDLFLRSRAQRMFASPSASPFSIHSMDPTSNRSLF